MATIQEKTLKSFKKMFLFFFFVNVWHLLTSNTGLTAPNFSNDFTVINKFQYKILREGDFGEAQERGVLDLVSFETTSLD